MDIVFTIATLISALLIQLIIQSYLPILGLAPELLLLTLLVFSLKYGSLFGEIYGFFSGLLLDCFTVHLFGLRALIFTSIGYFVGKLSHNLDESKIKVQILIAVIGVSFYYLFDSFFTALLLTAKLEINLLRFFFMLLYNSTLSPLTFLILKKIPIERK